MRIEIKDKAKCSGCAVCKNVCPKNCITMALDIEGFSYPEVDKKRCIDCGRCYISCPIINSNSENRKSVIHAFAAENNDRNIKKESSSGGIFSLIAKRFIEIGGAVYGAAFDEKLKVVHQRATSIEEIAKFRGSKYVQSNTEKIYPIIEKDLKDGLPVLFSGTPCQVSGVKRYLSKDYANLFTVDIACMGVPSVKVWTKYLEYQKAANKSEIKSFSFRDKTEGWRNYSIKINFVSEKNKTIPADNDLYMAKFLSNTSLRPSCYDCAFKGVERVSDVTLADFWGAEKVLGTDDDTGISLVLTHTDKGEKMLNDLYLDNLLSLKEVDIDKACAYNTAILQSVKPNVKRGAFMKGISKLNFLGAVDYAGANNGIARLKISVRYKLSKLKNRLKKEK